MSHQISVNLDASTPEKSFIRKTVRHIADRIILPPRVMSISFVDRNKIHDLNRQYRAKDSPTDVLTFCFEDDAILSDVYICLEVVKENAQENGVPEEQELARVIAHAFAHSLGYEHDTDKRFKIMHDFEDFLLK
jgi:probable rRNA maturation factor